MPIHAKTNVTFARDDLGRFLAAVDGRTRRTIERGVERGARYSRQMAPKGKNRQSYADRPGYVPLSKSIRTNVSFDGNRGYWYSIAPHAGFVEEGTRPHIIEGKMYFWWKGGWFYWNNPDYNNWTPEDGAWVYHPGTQAQPFLRPAYERLTRGGGMQDILREEFRRR